MQYVHVPSEDIINNYSFLFSSQFFPPRVTTPLILEPDDCKYFDVFVEELMDWVIQNDPKKYVKFDVYFDSKPNENAVQETKLRLISFNPQSGNNEDYTSAVWKLPYDKTVNVITSDSIGARIKHSSIKFLPVYIEQILPYVYLMLGTSAIVQRNLFERRFLLSLAPGPTKSYINGGNTSIVPYSFVSRLYETSSGIAVIPSKSGRVTEATSGNLLSELFHFNTTTLTKGQTLTQASSTTGVNGGVDFLRSSQATQNAFIQKMQNKSFDYNTFLYPDVTDGEITDYSLDKDIKQAVFMLLDKIRILSGSSIDDYLIFTRMLRSTLSNLFYLLNSTRRAFVDEGLSTLLINMARPVRPCAIKTNDNDLLIMDCVQGKFKGKADADAVLNKYAILDSKGEKFNFTKFLAKTTHYIFNDASRVIVTDFRFNILFEVTIPDTVNEAFYVSNYVHYFNGDNAYKMYKISDGSIIDGIWPVLGYTDWYGFGTAIPLPGTKTVIKDTHAATPVTNSDLDQYTGMLTSVERYSYFHPKTEYLIDLYSQPFYCIDQSIPRGTLKVGKFPGGSVVESYYTRSAYASQAHLYQDAFVLDSNNDLYAHEIYRINGNTNLFQPIAVFDTTHDETFETIGNVGGIDIVKSIGVFRPAGLPLNARYPELQSLTGSTSLGDVDGNNFAFSFNIPVTEVANEPFAFDVNYTYLSTNRTLVLSNGTINLTIDTPSSALGPAINTELESNAIQYIGLNYKKLFKFEHPDIPTSDIIMRFLSYFPYKLGLNMELNDYLNSNILIGFQEPKILAHNRINDSGNKISADNPAFDLYLHEEFILVGDPFTSLDEYTTKRTQDFSTEFKFVFNGIAPITWTVKGSGQANVTPTAVNSYMTKIKPKNDHGNFFIEAQDQFILKKLDDRIGHQSDTKNRKEFARCKLWPRTLPKRGATDPALVLKFNLLATTGSNVSITSSDTNILSVSTDSAYLGSLLAPAYLSRIFAKAKGQATITITHTRPTGQSYTKSFTVYTWEVLGLPESNQVKVGTTYNLSIDGTSSYPHQWNVSDNKVAKITVDRTDSKNCQLTILTPGKFWVTVADSAGIPWASSTLIAS